MIRTILVVESDSPRAELITAICLEGGFAVEVVPHESTLAHLSKHADDYCALIVRVAPQPSTLASADRMGEFVLRYVAQALPEFLQRTIVVTEIPGELRTNLPPVRTVLDDPFERSQLVDAIVACCNAPSEP